MAEVTQEDRDIVDNARLPTHMKDALARLVARHRIAAEQRGKLEGARLALEAAAREAAVERQPQKSFLDLEFPYDRGRLHAAAAIRALDPAKIVGEG